MLTSSLFINFFNRTTVIACNQNLAFTYSIKEALNGTKKPITITAVIKNSTRGIRTHITKETISLLYRPISLHLYKPWLDQTKLSPLQINAIFGATLTAIDIILHPIDTALVNIQAKKQITFSPRDLYAGALANTLTQYTGWFTFGYSDYYAKKILYNYSSIDPTSFSAILIGAYPRSLLITSCCYLPERLKLAIQLDPRIAQRKQFQPSQLNPPKKIFFNRATTSLFSTSTYFKAAKHVVITQDLRGLTQGFFPKTIANAGLVTGYQILQEAGAQNKSVSEYLFKK